MRLLWIDRRLTPKQSALQVRQFDLALIFLQFTQCHCQSTQGIDSHGRYANLHPSFANKIWMPDIYIDQVKQQLYFKYGQCNTLTIVEQPKLQKLMTMIFQNQGNKLETTNLLHQTCFFKVNQRKQTDF